MAKEKSRIESKNPYGTTKKSAVDSPPLFSKENYILMAGGLLLLALGFFLMVGGKSPDPKAFDPKEIYSLERITVAPILIILGFVIEIVAIMKKSK